MSSWLVIDDEETICWGLKRLGESLGDDVVTASSAEQGLAQATSNTDVILLDVRLPGINGLSAMKSLREATGEAPVIVMTAYGDLNTAVESVRNGAFEYVVKPFDIEQIQRIVARALKPRPAPPASDIADHEQSGLVGASAGMQEVFKRIALVAASDACVLIGGESGSGKELVARAIHRYSSRADGPFVPVNVASLSGSLVESELFGHARGAFTGADHAYAGLLAQANGGTLFLDEVADIPPSSQVKLLRALEHGEVTPVGSAEAAPADFRLISATHQDLLSHVREGAFRHDLYFRLCTFQIDVPPLRERAEDIGPLAEHFVRDLAASGECAPQLSAEAVDALKQRPWHGNVRELRNVVQHALIVSRGGVLLPEHLPPTAPAALASAGGEGDLASQLAALVRRWSRAQLENGEEAGDLYAALLALVEPPLLAEALSQYGGQCATAARRLGMHRTTLRKKLDDYGLEGK